MGIFAVSQERQSPGMAGHMKFGLRLVTWPFSVGVKVGGSTKPLGDAGA